MKLKTFFENMKPFREVSELYISNNKMKRKNKTTKRKEKRSHRGARERRTGIRNCALPEIPHLPNR
jgi:hypothetical protein